MQDLIVLSVLLLLVGGASAYIIRAKKKGVKCIGCPAGGACPGCCGAKKEIPSSGGLQKTAEPAQEEDLRSVDKSVQI